MSCVILELPQVIDGKLHVSLESIEIIRDFRRTVNMKGGEFRDINSIVWTRAQKPVEVDAKDIHHFQITGMSNMDFPNFADLIKD